MGHWKDFLPATIEGGRFLRWKEVSHATGLSRTTAWRLQKRDEFPSPYAISPGRVGYREAEVAAWCVSRDHSAGRGPPAPKPTAALTYCASRSTAPAGEVLTSSATGGAEQRGAPSAPSLERGTHIEPHAIRRTPRRRRSQHAQAIAQQMRLDF